MNISFEPFSLKGIGIHTAINLKKHDFVSLMYPETGTQTAIIICFEFLTTKRVLILFSFTDSGEEVSVSLSPESISNEGEKLPCQTLLQM